ncbi:MAG: SMC-Scp complex subunit ScpB [Pseudomonadota bacterium]
MEELNAIKPVLEASLLAAGRPLSIDELHATFKWGQRPDKKLIRKALAALIDDYEGRGIELVEVASGFRVQVPATFSENLESLHEERAPRYSRALLETLALIAYRQPITRGEIEEVRGVAVSSNIIRTLLEREWIRSVGHRDVPGRPEMFGTTKQFLDYFNLKKLDDLPSLSELTDIESLQVQLDLPTVESQIVNDPQGAEPSVEPSDTQTESNADSETRSGDDAPQTADTVVIVSDDAASALDASTDGAASEATDDDVEQVGDANAANH